MPLYEYKCARCGAAFEVIQKLAEPPIKKCPQCGGSVEKVISAPALQFKGSGWYITDYARKEKQPSEPKAKEKTTQDTTQSPPPAKDQKAEKETTSSAK